MKLDELAAKQVINDEVIDHFDEDFMATSMISL